MTRKKSNIEKLMKIIFFICFFAVRDSARHMGKTICAQGLAKINKPYMFALLDHI